VGFPHRLIRFLYRARAAAARARAREAQIIAEERLREQVRREMAVLLPNEPEPAMCRFSWTERRNRPQRTDAVPVQAAQVDG
jgi:hypothetical protein